LLREPNFHGTPSRIYSLGRKSYVGSFLKGARS
jgi:hypothetical protein